MVQNNIMKFDNESVQWDAPMEWWFIQGYFNTSLETHYFMISFFKERLTKKRSDFNHGCTLLISLYSTESKTNHIISRIDKNLFDLGLKKASDNRRHPNQNYYGKAFLDEIKEKGPIPPVELSESQPIIARQGLSVRWNEFQLEQTADHIVFTLPGCLASSDSGFTLSARTPRFTIMTQTDTGHPDKAMQYNTYPSCELKGRFKGDKIEGKAWLDHQFGSYGMFGNKDKNKVFGWDWFGFNLENGTNWLLMIHRDVYSGKKIAVKATKMQSHGDSKAYFNLNATPVRIWESRRTRIQYPVEWHLTLPGDNIEFHFKPTIDDQEIPLFGMHRSVWEGCGRVECIDNGRVITGDARGEFFGYGYISDFSSYLDSIKPRIQAHLDDFFPKNILPAQTIRYVSDTSYSHPIEAYNKTIFEPVRDLIERSGKFWRPLFSILMLESLGCHSCDYESILTILTELSHTGSLIIDDIEDNSPIRRDLPTIHTRYGIDVAINAGNTAYFLPFLKVGEHPLLSVEQKAAIYDILTKAYINAHFGQAADIFWSKNTTPENLNQWLKKGLSKQILQAYVFKTGAVLKGVAQFNTIVSGVDDMTRKACVFFAESVGVAFQIMDDIRNFTPEVSRKKIGEDIAEGKLTYIISQALISLQDSDKQWLIHTLCDPVERKSKANISKAINLINACGAIEKGRKKARRMFNTSWEQYCSTTRHSESRVVLKILCLQLLNS